MTEQVANTVSGQLSGDITDVQATATLVDASAFPTSGDWRLRVDDELMLVTGVAGAVLTVTRGIEGTANVAHADGRAVKMVHTAAALLAHIGEVAPGSELAYVEYTSDASLTNTTEGTAHTVVTAPAIVFDGATAVWLEFYCEAARPDPANIGATMTVLFTDGGTALGQAQVAQTPVVGANFKAGALVRRRLTPSAASHTYDARGFVSVGTGILKAGAGGAGLFLPGYIRITKA